MDIVNARVMFPGCRIDPIVANIRDLVAKNSKDEVGIYSPERLAQIISTLNDTDWEKYVTDFIAREKEIEEQYLNQLVRCPSCGEPEQRRTVNEYGECKACYQAKWDTYSIPCLICHTVYLPRGMYDRENSVCYTLECEKVVKQVQSQNIRARKANLTADLTLRQWVAVLHFFDMKCAYCLGKFDMLEHYIPVSLGGGTTQANCLPSCYKCNMRKKGKCPSDFADLFPAENMARIHGYFASLKIGV